MRGEILNLFKILCNTVLVFCNHLPPCVFIQLTGPWRSLWVRFGYDPRKHPEAKIYQVLDFRIRCGMKYGKKAQPTEMLSLLSD